MPGGDKGSNAMSKNLAVGNLLQQHYTNGKLVAAICAGMILERKNSRIWFFFVKVH